MQLTLTSPTRLEISGLDEANLDKVRKFLSFKDKKIEQQIRQTKSAYWMVQKFGEEYVQRQIDELKTLVTKTILFCDEKGYWTYPGMQKRLSITFRANLENKVTYPDPKLIPWAKEPFQPRPYQNDAINAMLDNSNGFGCGSRHISIGTGGGKALIILYLAKRLGLKTTITAPNSTITDQLYDLLVTHLGKKYVGLFSGSKKNIDKLITVATAQSLSRIEEGTEAWEFFQNKEVLLFDEGHQVAAQTFEFVCQKLHSNTPYRFFLTATPERNDGRDLVLGGIIGDLVYSRTVSELQEEGWLAKINTIVFDVESESPYTGTNMVKMNQKHLYNNKQILNFICTYVPKAIENNMPVLVLVDEHAQEELIRARIGGMYEYASSDSDNKDIVDRFNEGKIMCVIGTSAISTGVDFQRNKLTINWQGNRASVKIKQAAIGRSTRIHKESGKDSCTIIDFRVSNIPVLKRHANDRIKYYLEVGSVNERHL